MARQQAAKPRPERPQAPGSKPRGRVTKKASNSRASSKTPVQADHPKAYMPDEYPLDEVVYFPSPESELWEDRDIKLVPGIKKVKFSHEFGVNDDSIAAIIAAGTSFCHNLSHLQISAVEQTFWGGDEAIISLAAACPNLVHVSIEGAPDLTDASLYAILSNCPNVRYIALSGEGLNIGHVTGTALDMLRRTPDLGKSLVKLRLIDQDYDPKSKFQKALKALSRARKNLPIEYGLTHRSSGATVRTWLGGRELFGYQAFGAPGGIDIYGGYGRPRESIS